MNNIGAIWARHADPLCVESLRKIVGARHGAVAAVTSGEEIRQAGPVGLIQSPAWTPEPGDIATSPVQDVNGCIVVADARLDNRKELIAELGSQCREADPSDSTLIRAAYERWGTDCANHLLGDFAFILWDASRSLLLAMRDPMGVRLLYWGHDAQRVVIASTLGGVLAGLPVRPAINRPLIEDFLNDDLSRWKHETAWAGVFRVPQGHYLKCSIGNTSVERYYRMQPPALGTTDQENIEVFRELFRDSVSVRLRGSGPIGILLSGGLDSSSVAWQANQLVKSGEVSRTLRSYSSVFDETPEADERSYLAQILEACPQIRPTLIPSDDCWALSELGADKGYPLDEPDCGLWRRLFRRRLEPALADGCRSILTGYNGDQLLVSDPYILPASLRSLSLLQQIREFRHFRRGTTSLGVLARAYVPSTVKDFIRGRSSRWRDEESIFSPFASMCDRVSAEAIGQGGASARLSQSDTFARTLGFEWRHPFQDRRLVEFMFSAPSTMRFFRGVTKRVLRKALPPQFPGPIGTRRSKANITQLAIRGLERERLRIQSILARPVVVDEGYLSSAELTLVQQEIRNPDVTFDTYRRVSKVVHLEVWLRQNKLC